MARSSGWTCQRQSAGTKCRAKNPARSRKCATCGKARPARKKPAHMAALDLSYEAYVELNGGERCGICGRTRDQLPDPSRRLDRDHEHKGTGKPRGLLCRECNRRLKSYMTPLWLRLATFYLERTA
jgi:hypothetical protein